jgi:hypothetical protein
MVNKMANNTKSGTTTVNDKLNDFFMQNQKFFEAGDKEGKRGFFALGIYCRKVVESVEKEIATNGAETEEQAKFTKRINREIGYNMTYRSFSTIVKLLDNMAAKTNPKLLYNCSGLCKQYIINSECATNKKALPSADANLAFSLGMFQH